MINSRQAVTVHIFVSADKNNKIEVQLFSISIVVSVCTMQEWKQRQVLQKVKGERGLGDGHAYSNGFIVDVMNSL